MEEEGKLSAELHSKATTQGKGKQPAGDKDNWKDTLRTKFRRKRKGAEVQTPALTEKTGACWRSRTCNRAGQDRYMEERIVKIPGDAPLGRVL